MTVHASVELVEAMRGFIDEEDEMHSRVACGASDGTWPIWGWTAVYEESDNRPQVDSLTDWGRINCPKCIRAMREATDPVRYDFLRERGLVPELPLVSG